MLREYVTATAAGSADLAMAVMFVALAAFAATLFWVYGMKRAPHYEEVSRLPLEEANHE